MNVYPWSSGISSKCDLYIDMRISVLNGYLRLLSTERAAYCVGVSTLGRDQSLSIDRYSPELVRLDPLTYHRFSIPSNVRQARLVMVTLTPIRDGAFKHCGPMRFTGAVHCPTSGETPTVEFLSRRIRLSMNTKTIVVNKVHETSKKYRHSKERAKQRTQALRPVSFNDDLVDSAWDAMLHRRGWAVIIVREYDIEQDSANLLTPGVPWRCKSSSAP
ncbi:hypothetical protein BDZ89DRAFT_1041082 [Hymenopellis radicata]|nr:hypothetical protein BDZ89DRAFT_1041082 [Hymenopellis radicata]